MRSFSAGLQHPQLVRHGPGRGGLVAGDHDGADSGAPECGDGLRHAAGRWIGDPGQSQKGQLLEARVLGLGTVTVGGASRGVAADKPGVELPHGQGDDPEPVGGHGFVPSVNTDPRQVDQF